MINSAVLNAEALPVQVVIRLDIRSKILCLFFIAPNLNSLDDK